MWWLLFVAPFVCGGFCLWCLLRTWRAYVHGVSLPLHGAPLIQSCTQQSKRELPFSGAVVQICFDFFPYVAFNLAPPARNSNLSLTHYIICFVLLLRCFGVASVLWRCFCNASALLRRCFRVASALLRCCFGVRSAFLWLQRCFGGVGCNFGATSVQLRLNLGSTLLWLNQNLTASCSDARLCGLRVACGLQERELLKALNTFRCLNHERHNNTCFEVFRT